MASSRGVRSVFSLAEYIANNDRMGVLFYAEGHAKSDAMKTVFEKLSKVAPEAQYVLVDVKDIAYSREAIGVKAVPTLWVVVNQNLVDQVEVPQAPDYLALCKKYLVTGIIPLGREVLKDRSAFDVLIKGAKDAALAAAEEWLSLRPYVVLTEDKDKCQLLQNDLIPVQGRIILDESADPEMAQALRAIFPSSVTDVADDADVSDGSAAVPRLTVKHDLVIVDGTPLADDSASGLKMLQEDTTSKRLKDISIRADEKLAERCRDIINQAEVVLFMKGSKSAPYCKFSKAMSALMREAGIDDYDCFNVFTDEYIREKIKVVSNWKTFPQLYVRGQLIGGIDAVKKIVEDNGNDPTVLKKILEL